MRSELRYRTLASQLPDAAVYEYDHDLRIVNAQGGPLLTKLGGDAGGPRPVAASSNSCRRTPAPKRTIGRR